MGCSISRSHKSCYTSCRPIARTRWRRTPVRWGPRRLPPAPPSIRRPGSLKYNSALWPGKTPGPSPPLRGTPDLAPVRGSGRVPVPPAARTPARSLRCLRDLAGSLSWNCPQSRWSAGLRPGELPDGPWQLATPGGPKPPRPQAVCAQPRWLSGPFLFCASAQSPALTRPLLVSGANGGAL